MSSRVPLLAIAFLALALPAQAKPATVAVTVERAWMRPAPAGLPSSAAYFTVRNSGTMPDVLEGVSTPAGSASLHQSMDHAGMMSMQPVGPLTVSPGGSVELKPGGLHVMIEGLKRPLKPGERVALTLTFRRAGRLASTAQVRSSPP